MLSFNNCEVLDIKSNLLYKKEEIQLNFGSNSYALVGVNGKVMYDSHGLERKTFESVDTFEKWIDSENVSFEYQILIGKRNDKTMEDELFEGCENMPIDYEEDGTDIWSKPILADDDTISNGVAYTKMQDLVQENGIKISAGAIANLHLIKIAKQYSTKVV